jgi:hypothetical protein
MFTQKLTKPIAIGTVAIAVAIGAYAIGNSNSSNGISGTANAATSAQPAQNQAQPGENQNQQVVGQIPQNWRPGTGTIITGAAADEAKAVALAKYPGGTVNRVLKFSDGSYAVKYIKISWPHHVFVSEDFEVTGALG